MTKVDDCVFVLASSITAVLFATRHFYGGNIIHLPTNTANSCTGFMSGRCIIKPLLCRLRYDYQQISHGYNDHIDVRTR